MRYPLLIAASILIAVQAGVAEVGPSPPVEVLVSMQDADTELVYEIPQDVLNSSPAWNPEQELPPLSIAPAVAAARDHLGMPPEGTKYLLTSIQLSAVHGRSRATWYYLISFYPQTEWSALTHSKEVLVLLNGKVQPPRSRPARQIEHELDSLVASRPCSRAI
jgi:hypothetical protein